MFSLRAFLKLAVLLSVILSGCSDLTGSSGTSGGSLPHWQHLYNGTYSDSLRNVKSIVCDELNNLYAISFYGNMILRSTNDGIDWVDIAQVDLNGSYNYYNLSYSGGILFLSGGPNWFSTDHGVTWEDCTSDVSHPPAVLGDTWYVSNFNSVNYSTNRGRSWARFDYQSGFHMRIISLATDGIGSLFVTTEQGDLLTYDFSHLRWNRINSRIENQLASSIKSGRPGQLVLSNHNRIYITVDSGVTWRKIFPTPSDSSSNYYDVWFNLSENGSLIFGNSFADPPMVHFTADDGFTLTRVNNPTDRTHYVSNANTIFSTTEYIYNGYGVNTVRRSTDFGASWNSAGGYVARVNCNSIDVTRTGALVGMYTKEYDVNLWSATYLLRSADQGNSWSDFGLILYVTQSGFTVTSTGALLFVANNEVYRSIHEGSDPQPCNTGSFSVSSALCALPNGNVLAIASNNMVLLRSTDDGQNWQELQSAGYIERNHLVCDQLGNVYSFNYRSFGKSTDWGETWQFQAGPNAEGNIIDVDVDYRGSVYIACGYYESDNWYNNLYFSNDQGSSWQLLPPIFDDYKAMMIDRRNHVYVVSNNRVLRSDNSGNTFYPVNIGIPPNTICNDLTQADDGTIYLATSRGIFRLQE